MHYRERESETVVCMRMGISACVVYTPSASEVTNLKRQQEDICKQLALRIITNTVEIQTRPHSSTELDVAPTDTTS